MAEHESGLVMLDYGIGNLQSIQNAFKVVGTELTVINHPDQLEDPTGIVVPGVGSFKQGIKSIRRRGFETELEQQVVREGVPYLGICLGMQFLADRSYENGTHEGFGWIPGEVKQIKPESSGYTVPHVGWNELNVQTESILYKKMDDLVFYFTHSYHFDSDVGVTATTWHGMPIVASIRRKNIFGVQFHPEKSQGVGLKMIENFTNYATREA